MLFEEQFPGNETVMTRLLAAMATGGVTAFTGAGTSMPSLPAWGALVRNLVKDAEKDGRLDNSTVEALLAEKEDFLYVIDEIYNAVGKSQTKAKVAKIFASLERPTKAHKLITETKFERVLTLNYDNGLEMAHAEINSRHQHGITGTQLNEFDAWLRHTSTDSVVPILHWHGKAEDAHSIILAGEDYIEYYDKSSHKKESLRSIFKAQQVLMIGFGFSDPFIERELNSVMQPLPAANSHFALIGLREGRPPNVPLERRKYSSKYKLEPIFYPVRDVDGAPDHSALIDMLEHIQTAHPRGTLSSLGSKISKKSMPEVDSSYRSSLFTIGDGKIYCEPRLKATSGSTAANLQQMVSVSDLINGKGHVSITASHEYGLSTLGKRIASELNASGIRSVYREASSVPNYRKAIVKDADFSLENTSPLTVILDNFVVIDHQRLIRELIAAFSEIRIFVLVKGSQGRGIADGLDELNFTSYELNGFSRTDVRLVVNTVRPGIGSDEASTIVDKVYFDLLQLCIPLTPSNVIMYASVLCKDESFSPVSRLHIVDRFVGEALKRASDAYADAFNSADKIVLISEFSFNLYANGNWSFSLDEWNKFCTSYKKERLVEFSATEILGDLIHGRIIIKDGSSYIFRYKMFFSYFVGLHTASRPDLLNSCLSENKHLELDGLVEVLCGTLSDCSAVLDDLTDKFSSSIDKFYQTYPIKALDIHDGAKWELHKDENKLWDAVSTGLTNGPASTSELDDLKTSIHAERRTVDQKVSIIKFIASEHTVAANAYHVRTALEGAKQASAASKKAAARAVINANTLAYEVATVFIPLIAEKKYVSWNGFTYINLIEGNGAGLDSPGADAEKERMQGMVAYALPTSMGRAIADHFGSRKLGQVFLALVDDAAVDTAMKRFLLFCLLIRSKPSGWLAGITGRLGSTKRDDIYLKHMLASALHQFKYEINTDDERRSLKELVGSIRLKRDVNLKSPSSADLRKVIGKLEAGGQFELAKSDGDQEA